MNGSRLARSLRQHHAIAHEGAAVISLIRFVAARIAVADTGIGSRTNNGEGNFIVGRRHDPTLGIHHSHHKGHRVLTIGQ